MVARIIEVTRRGRKGEQGNPGPDNLAALTTGGSSTAYTITNASPVLSYADGYGVTIKAHVTSGVTPTANVDALGAKAIKKLSGGSVVAIAAGDMVINQFYVLHYSSVADALILFGGVKLNDVVDDLTPQLGAPLDTNAHAVFWSQGADVASATELLVLTDGNSFDVTGTTTIATIEDTADAFGIGAVVILQFDGVLTLTHHATNLVLPSAANITTAAGDVGVFQKYASGDWRCTSYEKADGTSLKGSVIQIVTSADGAVATGTTIIPIDDTIPQNTEGDEYLSVTITPKSTTNLLVIEGMIVLSSSASGFPVLTSALFQDSIADALSVSIMQGTIGISLTVPFRYEMIAGTVSATTFKIRGGGHSAGTTTLNGQGGLRLYGGTLASQITVTEYFAS